jgi:hypothetical protein
MESTIQNEYSLLPGVICTEKSIEMKLQPGEQRQGAIEIRMEDGKKIQGVVTSDNRRIMLAANSFRGENCRLVYGIDTKGLPFGSRIEGNLILISSAGEMKIPVRVSIALNAEKNVPEVRDLDAFAALCQKSLREGFRIFTDPSFAELLCGNDARYRALYRGMTAGPVTYQRMEEFLVASGRKEMLTFTADKTEKMFFGVKEQEQDTIYLYKNTWGYEQLEVSAEGSFISLSKKRILTDDFVGRVFALDYRIDPTHLGKGVRRGRIRITGAHTMIEIMVTASVKTEAALVPDLFEEQQRVRLYRCLLDRMEGRIDEKTWQDLSGTYLRELRLSDTKSAEYLLLEAFLAWRSGDVPHAMEFLWSIKDGTVTTKRDEERCMYLYLAKATTLLPDEQREILPEIAAARAKHPDSYLLLGLYLQETRSDPSPEHRFELLDECFRAGCCSPFLYHDALGLMKKNSGLFRKLSDFELCVLRYAKKREMMTEELAGRLAFLSHNLKRFSKSAYLLLSECYDQYKNEDLLDAICRLIVKGQPIRREYNRWYQLAIERNLRITQVYEYFMETAGDDASQIFPMQVLMYFSTNDTLGAGRKALLYASILLHRDDAPDICELYRVRMRSFAVEMLEAGKISENLAILYRNFFLHPQDGRNAALLSRVLFQCRMTVHAPSFRRVIVCTEGIEKEESYSIENGTAYINRYSDESCVIFEDVRRRRICTALDYEITPLLDARESIRYCTEQNVKNAGLLLAACGEHSHQMKIDPSNVGMYRLAESVGEFTETYRRMIRRNLLEYYLSRPDDFSRVEFVQSMNPDVYAEADKAGTVALLMEEGRYEETFRLLSEYGYENIAAGLLLQLASRMILRRDSAYDEELLYMTAYVYHEGKYNDDMLCYLRSYYDGPVQELCGLWRRLKGFQLDTFRLEEKILKQAVFAHAFPDNADEILRDYLKEQGNKTVATAFLAFLAKAELLEDHALSDDLLAIMERMYDGGCKFTTGMKICLLEYYSGKTALSADQMEKASTLLAELDGEDIRFGFFRKLPHSLIEKYQIEDKAFIEKRLPPGRRVMIHYRVQQGNHGPDVWRSEPMKDVYHGIYVKELLLFYGETVFWYLTEGEGKNERKLEENSIRVTSMDTRGESRFKLLNRIIKERSEGRAQDADKTTDRYLLRDEYVSTFFTLM